MIATRFNPLGVSFAQPTPAMRYIQDGLLAMWDGEENAGFGKHDAAATQWVDCVSRIPLTLDQYVTVAENAMTNDVTREDAAFVTELDTTLSNALTNELDEFTIEICEDATSTQSYYIWSNPWIRLGYQSTSESNGYFLQQLGKRVLGRGFFENKQIDPFFDKHSISLVVNKTDGTLAIYRNGALFSNVALGTYGTDCVPLRFGITNTSHNIRIYNRALSADEVAANYAINLERFGL